MNIRITSLVQKSADMMWEIQANAGRGDKFYHEHGWGECAHKQWAEEEMSIREASA